MKKEVNGIILAILAAVFYAINIPLSNLLLENVSSTLLSSLLYFGAGIGILIIYIFIPKKIKEKELKFEKKDYKYIIIMVVLDIVAPNLLLLGLAYGNAQNTALLNNFEIVATSLIALFIFKEKINFKLWIAIILILISSCVLTFEDVSAFELTIGSIFVLLASISWGFENNATKMLSSKSTYKIVIIKGIFSGLGSLIVSLIVGVSFPPFEYIIYGLLLGFVSYGLSIFVYIRSQNLIGAAKTSSFYAINPFIGVFLSFIIFKEPITVQYIINLVIMLLATGIIIFDTLFKSHTHFHEHQVSYVENDEEKTKTITHKHFHFHFNDKENHNHKHYLK